MPRTRNKSKYLRSRVDEVDNLWNKEQQHGFTKVTQDGDYSKGHPGKIAESVTNKNTGRIPAKDDFPRSHELPYFFGYKMETFFFQNTPKNLDPSYKTDLEVYDYLRRVTLVI